MARHLLQRVRGALVLNWRQKAQARAQVKLAIEDALDEGLPRAYTPDLYKSKCSVLFEHVFETYSEGPRSSKRPHAHDSPPVECRPAGVNAHNTEPNDQ